MSRAFVREDDPPDRPPPAYRLPSRDDPGYEAAAAAALLQGAREGNTASAEEATGFAWGARTLGPQVERLLAEARRRGDERQEQVAERFLRNMSG